MNEDAALGRKIILVVDDSEINRALLADMLSGEFDILEAENGMEASAILHEREQDIALMLLDIVMPVMDGFELLADMNKNGWIESVPVIMISAETVPGYVDRAYDLGVLDYISRPFDERIVKRRVVSTLMVASKQRELEHMVASQIHEKERDNKLMIEILSGIVEFRNGESGLHVMHIRMLTELLLKSLLAKTDRYGISKKDIPMICNAAALHDIGKITIPTEVLNKPGRLTKEEFEVMKTHSEEGAKILSNIMEQEDDPLVHTAYQICRWHHERYDGKGYPDGLKGEEIPIVAQVVALADVYDALTSERVYKPPYSHEQAMNMILTGECGAFNPFLLECFQDIAEDLKREMTLDPIVQLMKNESTNMINRMMESDGLDVSKRTIKLLEHERTKYQFFAALSGEIQFEYTVTPEMLILSEWGAGFLGLPETVLHPLESEFRNKVFVPDDFDRLLDELKNTTPEKPNVEGTFLLNIGGEKRWSKVLARSMWEMETQPKYIGAVGKIVDIHEDMEKMKSLELKADRDSLTGLFNHAAARVRIAPLLSMEGMQQYILLVFDLDYFKQANDRYGHLFGDKVLKHVANVIRSSIRSDDIAARMGGDEFLVFMPYKTADTIRQQVDRIFNQLCCEFDGFSISVSMGVSCASACGGSYETLFHMADEALYEAKEAGRGVYRFHESVLTVLDENEGKKEERKG